MELFFAGCESKDFREIVNDIGGNMLVSFYHMPTTWKKDGQVKRYTGCKKLLFIDSGAFSAMTLGSHIEMDEYIEFCRKTDADYYAVLDVIGNGEKTLQNQKIMEAAGLHPVPCYHYGEDWKYLDYYCKHYEYVALGATVSKASSALIRWLDAIFSKYPNQKFHGFGLTRVYAVMKYPWFSVDSSSWLMAARTGMIFDHEWGSAHHTRIPEKWNARIAERGLTREGMVEEYRDRVRYSALSYLQLQHDHKLSDFKLRQQQLHDWGFSPQGQHETTIQQEATAVMKEEYMALLKQEFPGVKDASLKLIAQQRGYN